MPILDFHVHPFRDASHCLNFYPERDAFHPAQLRQELAGAGITHICGSVLGWEAPKTFSDLQALNREALALKDILGDFYTPGFHIHPAYVEESCEEVEAMHRQGVGLMGELVPYLHGWGTFREQNLFRILEAASPYGMVCCYHTPWAFSMEGILSAFPGITFVAAHPGDRERVAEIVDQLRLDRGLENTPPWGVYYYPAEEPVGLIEFVLEGAELTEEDSVAETPEAPEENFENIETNS